MINGNSATRRDVSPVWNRAKDDAVLPDATACVRVYPLDPDRECRTAIMRQLVGTRFQVEVVENETELFAWCSSQGLLLAHDDGGAVVRLLGYRERVERWWPVIAYGPRMWARDGRVVSNFMVQALAGEDITTYGDGSQIRSFCYVDDHVYGLTRLMDTPDAFTGPVNLGNPAEITVLELARQVIEMTGSNRRIAFCPLPVDDPREHRPDTDLAESELGWRPGVSLQAGLASTVAYFREWVDPVLFERAGHG